MSLFGFGRKEVKDKTPSVEIIKSTLETYRRVVTESIDYAVGDYIVRKPEANVLKLSEHQPEICYVLEIKIKDDEIVGVDAAYVRNDRLCIGSVTHYLYKKASDENSHPDILGQFVADAPINKDVAPGTFVRSRIHLDLFKYDHHTKSSSVTTISKKLYAPVLVMYNDDGQIGIVGCAEDEERVVSKTVCWYELSPYHEK